MPHSHCSDAQYAFAFSVIPCGVNSKQGALLSGPKTLVPRFEGGKVLFEFFWLWWWICMMPLHRMLLILRGSIRNSRFTSCHSMVYKFIAMLSILLQKTQRLHPVFFVLIGEHVWHPFGTNFLCSQGDFLIISWIRKCDMWGNFT